VNVLALEFLSRKRISDDDGDGGVGPGKANFYFLDAADFKVGPRRFTNPNGLSSIFTLLITYLIFIKMPR